VCGRYAASRRPEELVEEFEVEATEGDGPGGDPATAEPDFNVAPTKRAPVVLERVPRGAPSDAPATAEPDDAPTGAADDDGDATADAAVAAAQDAVADTPAEPVRWLRLLKWGLVPSWAKDASVGNRMINARAETLLDKPSFRDAARHRRCLVPADGFYEWEKQGRVRLPHYFTLKGGEPFFFAGLWEPARDDAPAAFCIVTTTPNDLLQHIHDRMPVILGPNSGPVWLGDEPLDPAQLARLCRPLPAEMMTGHRVDPRVNNVRYDAPDCIAPI